MSEYEKFVELHNINREIALQVYSTEREYSIKHFGDMATPFLISRNALFQLRIITGIKHD